MDEELAEELRQHIPVLKPRLEKCECDKDVVREVLEALVIGVETGQDDQTVAKQLVDCLRKSEDNKLLLLRLGAESFEEVEQGFKKDDVVLLRRLLEFVVQEAAIVGPPTIWEADANLKRSWKTDMVGPYRVYPQVLVKEHVERPQSSLPFYKQELSVLAKLGLLLEYFKIIDPNGPWHTILGVPSMDGPKKLTEPSEQIISSLGWHKYQEKFAVGLKGDVVNVYNLLKEEWELSLSHEYQRDIRCMEWQPLNGYGLAVGCGGGICVWANHHGREESSGEKEAIKWMLFLETRYPVTTLAWSPNGRFLASGGSSLSASEILVWDIATRKPTKLTQEAVKTLSWSPKGEYLCATRGHGRGFTIWETKTWDYEIWSDFASPIHAATWGGPHGKTLVIATGTGELIELYAIDFPKEPPMIHGVLVPITLELSTLVAPNSSHGLVPVTQVKEIAWNDTGERLAVSFENGAGVAIFGVKHFPILSFFFLGYVWGPPGYIPRSISFKPRFERGALLMVSYEGMAKTKVDNAMIRFIPMYFR